MSLPPNPPFRQDFPHQNFVSSYPTSAFSRNINLNTVGSLQYLPTENPHLRQHQISSFDQLPPNTQLPPASHQRLPPQIINPLYQQQHPTPDQIMNRLPSFQQTFPSNPTTVLKPVPQRPDQQQQQPADLPLPSYAALSTSASAPPQATPQPPPKRRGRKPKYDDAPVERTYVFRKRQSSSVIPPHDDEDEVVPESKEEVFTFEFPTDVKIIEKVIAIKGGPSLEETQFLLKYKARSYRAVEWHTGEELTQVESITRVRRWMQKRHLMEDEEEFNQDYLLVERIIQSRMHNDQMYYLVKWAGGLGYVDCTWERAEDLGDDDKIAEYKRFHILPSPENQPRPLGERLWRRQTESKHYKHDNTLRPYQLEGLNWLIFNWCKGRCCILADEMGLGKTIQVVTFFEHLKSYQILPGPFLVITPLSTVEHWKREIVEWTDMNVVVYLGTKQNRELIKKYEWFYLDQNDVPLLRNIKFNALITTYEMIMNDLEVFKQIHWQVIVVDEAQRLKNNQSKLYQGLLQISTYHKILLTGTPIQNNVNELWTLLHYIEPVYFSTIEKFKEICGDMKTADQINRLQQVIQPYLLRRIKDNVEKSIPPKEEILIQVELTLVQKKYYRALYEKNREFLNKGCVGNNIPHLQNLMIQIRKVCNHPFLIPGVRQKECSGETYDSALKDTIKAAGKLMLLDKLLPKLKEDGHKVLIFSQLKGILDILEDYMKYKSYTYERIDGSVRSNDRQQCIDRFMRGERFVFLLCTRAGGIGINLSEADTVIIYDSDWNPQNDLQAQARCHRIGQTKEVKVYRLISRNTYEQCMFERASQKLGLDLAILSNINDETRDNEKLSKEEINQLLKYGAYGILKEDDQDIDRFCEENIDQILENRTSKVVWKNNVASTSSFSKATFFTDEGTNFDINDPTFWDKVLPKKRSASELLAQVDDDDEEWTTWPEETLTQFLEELNQHIEEVVQAYQEAKGKIHSSRDTLIKVITALLRNADVLGDETVVDLQNKREILKFSRKKHKPSVVQLEDEDEAARQKHSKIDENIKRRVYEQVINLGQVSFETLRVKAGVTSDITQDALRGLALRFLKQCIAASDAENVNRKYFSRLLESYYEVKKQRRGGRRDVLKENHQYQFREEFAWIKPYIKRWEKILKYIHRLSQLVTIDTIPEVQCKERPTSWWTDQCNTDLLKGLLKYGFTSRELLMTDPTLVFTEILEAGVTKKNKREDDEVFEDFPQDNVLDRHGKLLIFNLDKMHRKQVELERARNEHVEVKAEDPAETPEGKLDKLGFTTEPVEVKLDHEEPVPVHMALTDAPDEKPTDESPSQ